MLTGELGRNRSNMPSRFDSFIESEAREFTESPARERSAPKTCSQNFGVSYARADICYASKTGVLIPNEFLSYYENEGLTTIHPSNYDNLQDSGFSNYSYLSNFSGQIGAGFVSDSLRVVPGPTAFGYEAMIANVKHYVLTTRFELIDNGITNLGADVPRAVVVYVCDGSYGMSRNIPTLGVHPEMRVLIDRGDGVASFQAVSNDRTGIGQEFQNQHLYEFAVTPGVNEKTLIIPAIQNYCNPAFFVAANWPRQIVGDWELKYQFEIRTNPGNIIPDFSISTNPTAGVPVVFTSVGPNANGRIGNLSQFKNLINYHWNFGDGSSASGTGSSVPHTYAASGTYTAILTFTDNNGYSGTKSRTFAVA